MKRYAVFAGSHYYPRGGFFDLTSSHESMADAFKSVRDVLESDFDGFEADWCHIVDIETGKIVHDFNLREKAV